MSSDNLCEVAYNSLLTLATDDGIHASGKEDVYSCIFGRDTAVTILKILKALNNSGDYSLIDRNSLLEICSKGLTKLVSLQGRETNIESGEEPGKFIHEYRKDNYDRLIKRERPWYVYPDNTIKNYDSLDSTPLTLIALYRYWELTKDNEFLLRVLPAVERGLNWIITYGDLDKDRLLEYELPIKRKHGGLYIQSWTDSRESLLDENGKLPMYPIAPVEVQGYAWLALKLWGDFYSDEQLSGSRSLPFAQKLLNRADFLKERFNETFLFRDSSGLFFPAQALDGEKNQIKTVTGSSLLLLWASYRKNGKREAIIDDVFINDLIKRSFQGDLFDEDAGIRTMSTRSRKFNPQTDSYHNGSFWPKLNGMAHEGLEMWDFTEEAARLRQASIKPLAYFGTPVELYVKNEDGTYLEYFNHSKGQRGCRVQAWSAAVALDLLTR